MRVSLRAWPASLAMTAWLVLLFLTAAWAWNQAPAPGPETAWREVTDEMGRRVRAPLRPRRIVTLTPSLAETVCALGLGGRLAGVSQWSDYPAQAAALPQVGSYVSPNLEGIVALGADLVLASRDGNPFWAVERLERARVPVYVTWPREPQGLPASLARLGEVCGAPQAGRDLAARLEWEMAAVAQALEAAQAVPALLVIGSRPLVSVAPETFSGRLLALAGGSNVVPAGGPAWPRLPPDFVVRTGPRVVILSSMGADRDLAVELADWRTLPGLAGRSGYRVERVASDLIDRPGPRLGQGLLALARALHPERFPRPEERP